MVLGFLYYFKQTALNNILVSISGPSFCDLRRASAETSTLLMPDGLLSDHDEEDDDDFGDAVHACS